MTFGQNVAEYIRWRFAVVAELAYALDSGTSVKFAEIFTAFQTANLPYFTGLTAEYRRNYITLDYYNKTTVSSVFFYALKSLVNWKREVIEMTRNSKPPIQMNAGNFVDNCYTTEDTRVDTVMEQYFRKLEVKNLSGETIKLYNVHLHDFIIHCDLDTVTEISPELIDNYILSKRAEETANDRTVNSYLRSIRVFVYYCMNERNFIPSFKIPLPRVDKAVISTVNPLLSLL